MAVKKIEGAYFKGTRFLKIRQGTLRQSVISTLAMKPSTEQPMKPRSIDFLSAHIKSDPEQSGKSTLTILPNQGGLLEIDNVCIMTIVGIYSIYSEAFLFDFYRFAVG